MSNEIKINKQIQTYAEDFIPYAMKIDNFLKQLSSLYSDELRFYIGEAQKEISTYSSSTLQQISVLSQNYACLSENLRAIVVAFLEFDNDSETKINQFYSTVINKSGIK